MKRKRIFLSFLMILSVFCFVSCTKKQTKNTEDNKPKDPQITVSIENRTYYIGEKLEDIDLILSNTQIGSVYWDNEDYALQLGNNVCRWTFTPKNSAEYNSKSGTITIVGSKELISPVVSDVQIKDGFVAYNEALFSTIELECSPNTPGTISIVNFNNVFVMGNNTCNWLFTPSNTEDYKSVSGSVVIEVTQNQFLSSISVKTNTKDSGYIAFDEFDCSGLTLNLIYNAGKTLTVSNIEEDCLVEYLAGNCLHQGDTKVSVFYQGKKCDAVIESVGYKEIEKPIFLDDIVYDGTEKELKIASSTLYTFQPLYETNAGEYDLSVSLVDSNNYKWKNNDTSMIVVKCLIKKAAQTVSEVNYSGEYDGVNHGSYVESDDAEEIHYSTSELTKDNYSSAQTTVLNNYNNAGNYTVYYYSVGDNNHNDKTGTLSVSISKQSPNLNLLGNCYTLKTGCAISYPSDYVELKSKQNVVLDKTNITYTYYTNFSNNNDASDDIKTTNINGAATVGGAPINDYETAYYVVVEYAGDGANYDKSLSVARIFIDKEDNGLFDTTGSNKFAFKDDIRVYSYESGSYVTTGSDQECTCYLEFNPLAVNQYGFVEVEVTAKFESGNENVKTGKLIYENEKYQLVLGDDTYELVVNTILETVTVKIGSLNKQLSKWILPSYLKTYTAETVAIGDYNYYWYKNNGGTWVQDFDETGSIHTSQNSVLTIYNDYGTIRFTFDVNVRVVSGGVYSPAAGGHKTYSGVVETSFMRDSSNGNKTTCKLDMFIIGDAAYRTNETSQQRFAVKWCVVNSMEPTIVDLYDNGSCPPFNEIPYGDIQKTYSAN